MTSISALGTVTSVGLVGSWAVPKKVTQPTASTASSVRTPSYSSPIYTFDAVTGAAIIEYRDKMTGAELYQTPSRASLLYKNSQQLAAFAKQPPHSVFTLS